MREKTNRCLFTIQMAGIIFVLLVSTGSSKTLIDYFLPMPIVEPLRSDKWGCASVGKRDICNGLEDETNSSYSYWDGPIIKGPGGKYHMFASRWNQSGGHWAWLSSVGVHAVSESVTGPYVDKGLTWPTNSDGRGHNLTILQLKDGTYASVVSDTRPGDFFTASSLDGPWSFAGSITIDANGFNKPREIANLSIIIRPDDGKFMVIERHGQIMTSDNLTGPYKVQCNSIYSGLAPNLEDPVLWYSGGYYHVVVNSWSDKKAYHLRSGDGIHDWTNEGLAFDPRSDFLRYTDGTVNHWTKIERPGVFIENGHITHWTFSVIDSEKEDDQGNDDHNSKVIVVPFDGAAFDGANPPLHRDTVFNGGFDEGSNGWTLNVWDGEASGEITDGEYKVTISNLPTNSHDIQLVQAGLILRQGNFYKVSFDARAAESRPLEVNVEMENDPWTSYLQSPETFDLSTNKSPYSFTFEMEHPTDSSSRLSFNCGESTHDLFLDNITIEQVEETGITGPLMSTRHSLISSIVHIESFVKIELECAHTVSLSLKLFDSRGRIIRKEIIKAGQRYCILDFNQLSDGIYFIRLMTGKKLHGSYRFIHQQ